MDENDIPLTASGWEVIIPTDDASIARRRRALAPIQTLTDIERNKSSLAGEFWAEYDLFNVALAVIDQVALAMGISEGRTWDETLEYAIGQARRQRPDAPDHEWIIVGERVLVSLVTTEIETVPYLVHSATGPVWRAQRFRLLYVHGGGSGGVEHLRASEQAINIFVDALDLDIEAAQVANEAQLTALIARGAVASAVQLARHARYQSIQYQERIRKIIADTLLDPDTHDWVQDVPAVLDSALFHVRDRLKAEAVLLDAVADRRIELADPDRLVEANTLIEILRGCRHRHNELHSHLIGARSRLRSALDDRFARPKRTVRRFDLSKDLLDPFVGLDTRAGAMAAETVVSITAGLSVSWWPTLATLTDELVAPPRESSAGEEYVPPDFDLEEHAEWWEPYEQTVDALFGAIEEPIQLSQLLALAADIDLSDVDDEIMDPSLLDAAIIHAAHRSWATRLAGRSVGDRVVVAVRSGRVLQAAGLRANDLLLVPGIVHADIAEHAVVDQHDETHLLADDMDDLVPGMSA